MNRGKREILAAFLMGMLLPGIIFNTAASLEPSRTASETETSQSRQEATQASTTEKTEGQALYISVQTGAGEITVMDLENYVRGVVLAEMPASFEEDALKAQAVVARTYALRRQSLGDRHPDGAVCTDPACCQDYISDREYLELRGQQWDLDKVAEAVADTAGTVLTYGGELIDATYFSCSGGKTEDAAAVWGMDVPYLQSVDSPGEEGAESYRQEVIFSAEDFSAALGRNLQGKPESWLGKVTYTEGGGVDTMYIGGICYSGTQLRGILGLNSTAFTLTARGDALVAVTRGHGHRVGMSQYGADAMAVSGSTWEEILAYYYQGTRIDKITDLE